MSQTVRMIFTKGQLGIMEFGTRLIILLHGLIIRCWLYLQLFQPNNQHIQLWRRAMLHKSDQLTIRTLRSRLSLQLNVQQGLNHIAGLAF